MTYNGANRVLQETDPAGNTVAYEYHEPGASGRLAAIGREPPRYGSPGD